MTPSKPILPERLAELERRLGPQPWPANFAGMNRDIALELLNAAKANLLPQPTKSDEERASALFAWFTQWIEWSVGKNETPRDRILADYATIRAEATLAERELCAAKDAEIARLREVLERLASGNRFERAGREAL